MAGLTWRDVAGGGYGGHGGRGGGYDPDLLARGIQGFNEALSAVVNRKNNRQLADIQTRLGLQELEEQHQARQAEAAQGIFSRQQDVLDAEEARADKEEAKAETRSQREWGMLAGRFSNAAFEAGANGLSSEDLFNSEAFRSLPPELQRIGAADMAEKFQAGKAFAHEKAESERRRANDDERTRFARNEEARREAEYQRLLEERKTGLEDVRPEYRNLLVGAREKAASEYAKYSGASQEGNPLHSYGHSVGDLNATRRNVDKRLRNAGLTEVPENVLKLFASDVGKNGKVKGRDAEDTLYDMAVRYHHARRANEMVTDEISKAISNPEGYRTSGAYFADLFRGARGIKSPEELAAEAAERARKRPPPMREIPMIHLGGTL